MPKHQFQIKLADWYLRHKRELPWRNIKDPYRIWLSEIILQQTRVDQGMPYYMKFVSNYPDVGVLAQASEDQVLKDWEGLGYYSRARNLHATAKFIFHENGGEFPRDYEGLLKLKGVGEYTAAAIGSLAFDIPKAVVDGNVFRFLSRYFGIATPINSSAGKREFTELANELLDHEDPGTFNQAMMEFGATQCMPRNPDCSGCPFNGECVALKNGAVSDLPVKIRKKYDRQRYFNYVVFQHKDEIWIKQRKENDIWRKLYEFELFESSRSIPVEDILEKLDQNTPGLQYELNGHHALKPHKLSHQSLHITITKVKIKDQMAVGDNAGIWIASDNIQAYGFPVPIRAYLERNQLTLPLE